MNNKLISIIIPVYNVEKYLNECLESVINQTYKNIEIIIIDDGSKDSSGKICDEYKGKDSRIKVIHKPNGGLSSARNEGLKEAKGQYIQFIDSDDYIDNDTIEVIYNIACKYDADIVSFSHYILTEEDKKCDYSGEIRQLTKTEALEELIIDNKIRSYSWEKLWRRELFLNIIFPIGRKFEDVLTTPLLFENAEKIIMYDMPKYYYRQRSDSILGSQSNELRLEYIEAVLEVNKWIKKKYPVMSKLLNYAIVNVTLNTYYDIGVFGMYDLLKENIVKKLYEMSREILKEQKNRQYIQEKFRKEKNVHINLLMESKKKYYEKYLELPVIYPEYAGKGKKLPKGIIIDE